MLYAVAEIAVFMIGATTVGFLLGRMTKRSTTRLVPGDESAAELESVKAAVRQLEMERATLKGQLADAKERVRQLAAEPTATESSEATEQLREKIRSLERDVEQAEARADRLRATIADRDSRISQLTSGEPIPEPESAPVGYSSSAGTLTDMRIVFNDGEA
jgi:septal ring factor EnvC (AmiA/AmiB activator)